MKRILTFILIFTVTLGSGLFCFDDDLSGLLRSDEPADVHIFPNTPSARFWTSSMNILSLFFNIYYYIDFRISMNVINSIDPEEKYFVRCISTDLSSDNPHETQVPVTDYPRFEYINYGTVTDLSTGFIWLKCPLSKGGQPSNSIDCKDMQATYTRSEAIAACENLNFAGKANWRLPTVPELLTIRKMNMSSNPAIY